MLSQTIFHVSDAVSERQNMEEHLTWRGWWVACTHYGEEFLEAEQAE